jgi:hypothetical protein
MHNLKELISHTDWAIAEAIKGHRLSDRNDSELWDPLPPDVLGMSGALTRVVINALCARPPISYLEVGLAGGSTFISATHNNMESNVNQFVGVEAWSPDHFRSGKEVKEKFYSNFKKYNGDIESSKAVIGIIEANFFNLNLFERFQEANLKAVNCYFYDADHSENATWWGLAAAYCVLDDYFIYIVDDWNDQHVRKGAIRAIKDLGLNVHRHYQFCSLAGDQLIDEEGKSKIEGIDPDKDFGDYRFFYNGIGIFVLEKNENSLFEFVATGKYKEFNESLILANGSNVSYTKDPMFQNVVGMLNPPGNLEDLQWSVK